MMTKLASGDVLIAAKLDRLFRSASDALNVVEQLKARGVEVVLVDIGTDAVTSNGVAKMFFTIMAALAEFERERIAERTADGRKSKRKRGGFTGGKIPYGYRVAGAGRDAALLRNEDEQAVIDMARKARAAGAGLREIARALTGHGIYSRDGKPFDPTQIKRMLEFKESGTIQA